MPNAKDITKATPRILSYSEAGHGKTTQYTTFPGKKFAYLFDPHATQSLRGCDIDYEEFLSDRLPLTLTSLSKDVRARQKTKVDKERAMFGAEKYKEWEDDFEERLADGFFDPYDSIMIDSLTTLGDMIMDGVLSINGRAGQWPQQDDYAPQMLAIKNIFRSLTSMGKVIYLTAHCEPLQDGLTKRVSNQIVVTGKLRTKLPILFSDIIHLEAASDGKGNVNYNAQTKPDRTYPLIRCSNKELQYMEDVELDFNESLEGQGLAGLLL